MEPSVDSLLAASAPPVAPRSAELERLLRDQVADSEARVSGPRRGLRSRIAIGALAAAGLVGLSAGASAAGVLPAPDWAPWYQSPTATHTQRVASGAVCDVIYGVKAIQDPHHPVGAEARAEAVVAAREYVRRFDFSTIDVAGALKAVPPTAFSPDSTSQERETFAVQYALQERLDAHLTGLGLPATVAVSTAQTCRGGAS